MKPLRNPSGPQRVRFWSFVQRGEGCWLWTGAISGGGYGVFGYGGTSGAAHRIAVILSGRPLTEADVVMHTCDNRLCVNPEHLRVGTQTDNVRDMVAKGRTNPHRDRQRTREELRREDAIKYLDYLHANLCGFAKALNVGPLPLDFEKWRKARYQAEEVA